MPHALDVEKDNLTPAISAVSQRKIIFVTEKWYEGDPARGDFACVNIVLDSLAATGMATYSTLWVDQHYLTTGQKIDAILLQQCAAQRPDIVVVMFHIGKPSRPAPPSPATASLCASGG